MCIWGSWESACVYVCLTPLLLYGAVGGLIHHLPGVANLNYFRILASSGEQFRLHCLTGCMYNWSLYHSSNTRIEMQIMHPNERPIVNTFCLELPMGNMRVEPSTSLYFYAYAHVQQYCIFTDNLQIPNLVFASRCSFIQILVHMYIASVSYMNISITKWSVQQ